MHENREKLVTFICDNAIELIQDPYGNYAVQEVMEKWSEQDFQPLVNKVKFKVAQLSIQKFSSNVVEKCLLMSDIQQRNDIIFHIAKIDKLVTVMRNSYGNYVVQKALYLSNEDVKIALADAIYENIPVIQDKKIRVKWAQLLQNSIANDLNFAGRYNFDEYLQDCNITSSAIPGLELIHQSSSNDSGMDMSLH